MKKILLFTLITLISYFTSISYSQSLQKISGGLYVGPSLSWLSSDSKIVDAKGMHFGYNFGATMDVNFSENFAFSLALGFNNVGGKVNYIHGMKDFSPIEYSAATDLSPNSLVNYNINYIELPIGFKGKTKEISYFTYFLKAGVTPLICIKGKADIPTEKSLLVTKSIGFFNLGWFIGAGTEFSIAGNTRLLVELAYTNGIFNVVKYQAYNPTDIPTRNAVDVKTQSNCVQLKLGILF